MAGRVPSLLVPEVAPSGAVGGNTQQISASPDAFGAQTGRATQQLGSSLNELGNVAYKIGEEKQNQVDETHVADVNNWLSNKVTEHWSNYQRLEGRAATDELPKFKQGLDDLYKQSVEQAGNANQRLMLTKTGLHMTEQYYRYGSNHSDTQFKTWQTSSATLRAGNQGNLAAISEQQGDFDGMQTHLTASDDEVRKIYETKGYGEDETAQAVAKNRGTNLAAIIKQKADNEAQGPVEASNFFHKVEGQMDSASRIAAMNYLRPKLHQQEANDLTDAIVPIYGPKPAIAGMPGNFAAGIMQSEGYRAKAYYDGKQYSIGYGTKANSPDEVITPQAAAQRFQQHIGKAADIVDGVNPNLDPGTRAALISLTYNTGKDWVKAGLGDKIRAGDIAGAKESFLQYVNAGGQPVAGLVARRAREASWFGKTDVNVHDAAAVDKEAIFNQALTMTDGHPETQDRLLNNLTRRMSLFNQQQTAAKADFGLRVKDSTAEALSTGNVKAPMMLDEFTTAYGNDAGTKAYGEYKKTVQLGTDIHAIAGMSPEDLAKTRESYAPQPGEGYADQLERQQQFDKAISQTMTARAKDPAAFALARLPAVQDADNAMRVAASPTASVGERRAAFDRYAAVMKSEQTRIGIPEDQQQLVPDAYVDRLNAILQAPAANGGSQNVADRIKAEAQLWGNNWPQVYRQLAKKTTPIVRVIGSDIADLPARILTELNPLSVSEILKDQNDERAPQVRKDVLNAFKPFAQTMVGNEGSVPLFNDFRGQGEKLAAYYVMRGESSSDAAQHAFKDLLGDKYTFKETYRIPNTIEQHGVKTPLDPAIVQAGAAAARDAIGERPKGTPEGKFDMIEPGNIDLENRPVVRNPDGSVSTVRSMSANIDGNEVLLSTVSRDGKIMSGDEAIEAYRRTGKHLGKFATPDQATAYAQALHKAQEGRYAQDNILDINPPASMAGVSDRYLRQGKIDDIKRNGVWVTSPSEDGLMLVYKDEAVRREDGQPLIVPWEQLTERGKQHPGGWGEASANQRRASTLPYGARNQ